MKKVSAALLVFAAIVLSSCRNDNDKPELIDRLRGLGAFTTPLVTTPSNTTPQKVTITAYAAVMNGDTVTVTPYVDAKPSSTYATPETDITIDPNNIGYTALDGFRLLKFTATSRGSGGRCWRAADAWWSVYGVGGALWIFDCRNSPH